MKYDNNIFEDEVESNLEATPIPLDHYCLDIYKEK